MLNVYPSEQIKPSRLLGLPNGFVRPAFEKLYGFDVPADQTLRGQPGLFDDIIATAPLVGTVRYATDIDAIMVYSSPDWQVYYSTHLYNYLRTNWETFSSRSWDNMT
jgi:hypothetical protein